MLQVWNMETEWSNGAGYEEGQMSSVRREEEKVTFIDEVPGNADVETRAPGE